MPHALLQFVEDEMLRAPLLFDQLIEGTIDHARKGLAEMTPLQRSTVADLMQALMVQRPRLADYFMRSLREQVQADLKNHAAKPGQKSEPPRMLSLVDEDVVALDVELSHTIEAIKSVAEYELRELQTYLSSLVGDMDVASDHNPFRAETFARAVWAAAQALPMSRGHQVSFMRYAGTPLAQLLRKSYAASSSRLESMGIEPAAYRTVILPTGSRRGGRAGETIFNTDLHRVRDSMLAEPDLQLSYDGQSQRKTTTTTTKGPQVSAEHWSEVARNATSRVDRQSIELVSRLFEAMLADPRVPADVRLLISRLHGPAMRLTLRDPSMLDQDKHPLWRFINRLAYEAEMAPDPADPERHQLLKAAQATIDQLTSEADQHTGLYRWALDRLEAYLHKRLTRRLVAAASQIGALQKLEDKLSAGQMSSSSVDGILDVSQLDTMPADLFDTNAPASTHSAPAPLANQDWLDGLSPGDWVRLFLEGRWVHARLLWPGERREVWLFGDGASDATWAVRRGALLMMYTERLAKTLKQRSIVASAAARVQQQVTGAAAA